LLYFHFAAFKRQGQVKNKWKLQFKMCCTTMDQSDESGVG